MTTIRERPRGPRRPGRRALAAATAALAACCAAGAVLAGGGTVAGAAPAGANRPNVVVVMSDDQTVQALKFQRHVLGEIADRGATFENNYVNFPLCCPSRTTFMTGLYAHNHHVVGNKPPLGGFDRFERLDSGNTLPLWLQRAGYHTGQVGKFLNGYGVSDPTIVPPGWDEWYGISGGVKYYDYRLNENGTLVSFGDSPASYVDDVITGRADEFIRRVGPASVPFFLYVAYKAPHGGGPHVAGPRCEGGPPEPPPRHFGEFADAPLPRPPSFNEADVSDKPRFVQKAPLLTPERIAEDRTLYQCELESLQGVDDGVHSIVHSLKAVGELRNTLLVYTSDNGFFHGEHRIYTGKSRVYEPSVRVPLVMRGPGIPEDVKVRDLTINADLAPTIVDAAHANADRVMNGRPILADTRQPRRELGRELLLEGRNFAAIRTQRYKYVSYRDGEQELYDLQSDPDELQNLVADPTYARVRSLLASELSTLRNCRRGNCHRLPKLDTKLHYSRGDSPSGGRCARGNVTATLRHLDSRLLVEADFRVHGNGADVTSAPFELVITPDELDVRHRLHLNVTADLLDGREMTLAAKLPLRCP
jgi:arylsulfatase A-like enzyme